ncbi:hypothetical protein [Mucilaginibacter dorajii]|uniref:Uncharacterized protein n=1 Tax=Mucilaginibacter dorajii TaxID=692994 RepID=A0ABP7QBC8_9SPHI|nr:hypothetical protein [Mucilaginibacter dorajii]MCS3733110.1 hypothetical protein [Mucilaginibacter dorajii]
MSETDLTLPDWNQAMPGKEEIKKALYALTITVLKETYDLEFVDYLDACVLQYINADVLMVQLAIEPNPVLQWFSSRNVLNQIDFVRTVLQHGAFEKASGMKGLKSRDIFVAKMQPAGFLLTGELAALLYNGGVYNTGKIDDSTAFRLSSAQVNSLCNSRYSHINYFLLYGGWSKWFYNKPWDYTYVIFNKATYVITVFCFTDTD